MSWRWYYDRFEPSRPRAAKGGIKAQSKRGTFGQSWWAKRWIAVLESFDIGARLGRGRSYARSGQVLSINIDKGLVEAKVQGSRSKPYDITIRVKALAASDWNRLAGEISHQAIFAAKLLAAEMPQDIEQAFDKAGLSLFPGKGSDLETNCSCPDWSNPCKHIAAVYYLLGEEFDRDPFLIFRMRGMSREEFIGLLDHDVQPQSQAQPLAGTDESGSTARNRRKSAASGVVPHEIPASEPSASKLVASESLPEPLTLDLSDFWCGTSLMPDNLIGEVRIPSIAAALPKRLGNFPFWRGEEKFLEAIEPIYAQASPHGLELFLGEWGKGGKG